FPSRKWVPAQGVRGPSGALESVKETAGGRAPPTPRPSGTVSRLKWRSVRQRHADGEAVQVGLGPLEEEARLGRADGAELGAGRQEARVDLRVELVQRPDDVAQVEKVIAHVGADVVGEAVAQPQLHLGDDHELVLVDPADVAGGGEQAA